MFFPVEFLFVEIAEPFAAFALNHLETVVPENQLNPFLHIAVGRFDFDSVMRPVSAAEFRPETEVQFKITFRQFQIFLTVNTGVAEKLQIQRKAFLFGPFQFIVRDFAVVGGKLNTGDVSAARSNIRQILSVDGSLVETSVNGFDRYIHLLPHFQRIFIGISGAGGERTILLFRSVIDQFVRINAHGNRRFAVRFEKIDPVPAVALILVETGGKSQFSSCFFQRQNFAFLRAQPRMTAPKNLLFIFISFRFEVVS